MQLNKLCRETSNTLYHSPNNTTSTQPKVVNVQNGENHGPIQPIDEVFFALQPWRFATPCYYLPRTSAPTRIATFASLQNQSLNTNINLVPTNLEIEQFQHVNILKQKLLSAICNYTKSLKIIILKMFQSIICFYQNHTTCVVISFCPISLITQ